VVPALEPELAVLVPLLLRRAVELDELRRGVDADERDVDVADGMLALPRSAADRLSSCPGVCCAASERSFLSGSSTLLLSRLQPASTANAAMAIRLRVRFINILLLRWVLREGPLERHDAGHPASAFANRSRPT
jgi:hypothetical protein